MMRIDEKWPLFSHLKCNINKNGHGLSLWKTAQFILATNTMQSFKDNDHDTFYFTNMVQLFFVFLYNIRTVVSSAYIKNKKTKVYIYVCRCLDKNNCRWRAVMQHAARL